jgi:DNA-binding response OmpR family regulator
LCVDDDKDICEIVRVALSVIAGLDVDTVHTGESAIDFARRRPPDLVLMDTMMPGLDGPSTLLRMRETPGIADVPVIFLTARVMPAEVAAMFSMGAIGVIAKPFDPVTLGSDISAIWARPDSARTILNKPGRRDEAGPPADELTRAFLERAQGDVEHIRTMVEGVRNGNSSMLEQAEGLAHSIHGAAAMFGYPGVSECGGLLERLFERTLAGAAGGSMGAAVLSQLEDSTERLARSIAAAIHTVPNGNALFHRTDAA